MTAHIPSPAVVKNRPTPEGRELGEQLARLFEQAFAEQLKQFPDMKQPCKTCAFRRGTFPNGCPDTVFDALKAVMEGDPFMCHHSPKNANGDYTEICIGWFVSYAAAHTNGKPPIKCPYPYSHEEQT